MRARAAAGWRWAPGTGRRLLCGRGRPQPQTGGMGRWGGGLTWAGALCAGGDARSHKRGDTGGEGRIHTRQGPGTGHRPPVPEVRQFEA